MSGKIICPNTKCGVKLGNYDWAGVHCNCKAWVVPVSAARGITYLRLTRDLDRVSVSIAQRSTKSWFETDDNFHASRIYTAKIPTSL